MGGRAPLKTSCPNSFLTLDAVNIFQERRGHWKNLKQLTNELMTGHEGSLIFSICIMGTAQCKSQNPHLHICSISSLTTSIQFNQKNEPLAGRTWNYSSLSPNISGLGRCLLIGQVQEKSALISDFKLCQIKIHTLSRINTLVMWHHRRQGMNSNKSINGLWGTITKMHESINHWFVNMNVSDLSSVFLTGMVNLLNGSWTALNP